MREEMKETSVMQKITVAYVFAVIFYQAMHLIFPFRHLEDALHLSVVSPLLAVLGFALLVWDLFTQRTFLKKKETYCLLFILVVLSLSSVVFYHYSFISSVKSMIWQAVQMLLIFPVCLRLSRDVWEKHLRRMCLALSGLFAVTNLVSLYQFFTRTEYMDAVSDEVAQQGFAMGRLLGVYKSPHYSSVFILLLMMAAIYYCGKTKNRAEKWMWGVFAVLDFLYAVLSGTRSVIVAMACALCVLVFVLWIKRPAKSSRGAHVCVSLLLAVCTLFGTVVVFIATDVGCKGLLVAAEKAKTEMTAVAAEVEEIEVSDETDAETGSEVSAATGTEETVQPEGAETAGVQSASPTVPAEEELFREQGADVSTGRIAIWKDYISIISDQPKTLILGASPGGYMQYIRENYPSHHIVEYIRQEYPDMYRSGLIYDTHNAYLGAFAMGGLLGLLGVLAFLLLLAVKGIRYVCRCKKISPAVALLFTMLLFILVASFFDSDLFFHCTSASVTFWFLSGLMLTWMEDEDRVEALQD